VNNYYTEKFLISMVKYKWWLTTPSSYVSSLLYFHFALLKSTNSYRLTFSDTRMLIKFCLSLYSAYVTYGKGFSMSAGEAKA